MPTTTIDQRPSETIPPWVWALGMALVLTGLCARLAIGGLPVQTEYPFATTILLDAGSRILDGQIPYRDFHTPIGFSYLGLLAGFLSLAHGLPHALALLSASAGAVIGAWAWWLAIARCPAPLAAATGLLVGLLVASPALFGYGPLDVSYGGHYSRLAWGLLATVAVQAALPIRAPTLRGRVWGEGAGTGVVLGLLLGIKFTFLFAAIALLALGWWQRRPPARFVLAVAAGMVAAVAAGLAGSGASLAEYLRDCTSVGGATPITALLGEYKRKLDFAGLAVIAAMAWWTWPAHRAGWTPSPRQALPEPYLQAAAILALGIVLSATTGIEDASPCYLLALLVLANGPPAPGPAEAAALRAAAGIAGALLCAFAARLALPIMKGPYAAASRQLVLAEGPWRNLDFMPAVAGTTKPEQLIPQVWLQPRNLIDNLWYLYLADGDQLLRPRVGAHERVLSLDYINPFPYQLGRPAPRGDLLYWSFDRNVTPATAPAPQVLFADADWVVVPRLPLFHGSSEPKQRLYLRWVAAHYRLEVSSAWWDCWHRTPAPAAR